MIPDFSRTLITMSARDQDGPVGIRKLDKDTWLADPVTGPLTLTYTVYGWELTVRCTHLDQTHGYFNGTSLFLSVHGQEDQPCDVHLVAPSDPACKGWRIATSMPTLATDASGFGTYRVKDYDELIDHPVEMGRFVEYQFDVAGIQHRLAVTGHVSADLDRFTRDLTNICAEHIALFQEPPPMPQYLFMLMVLNEGYGGLEHRNSTSLICQRDDLPQPKQKKPSTTYKKLMGLCSHEYFHSWNVKRIKPAAFTPLTFQKRPILPCYGGLKGSQATTTTWRYVDVKSILFRATWRYSDTPSHASTGRPAA